ncbi:MAG TPA: asparaginase [Blastocatellia bacterium]|nr:asparaginase [Blastocatellia bacterium]
MGGLPTLVEVRRGSIVEARHRGSIVAVEPDGHVVARLGDESMIVSTRSVIKPIQAIPVITSGAADKFNISSREMAVICASHEGETMHTDTVAGILGRLGLDQGALLCGAHPPYSEEAAALLKRRGATFNSLHNNCSGKHSGMLATAVHRGLPLEDYVSAEHAVQQSIIDVFRRIAELGPHISIAVDGCSAPTFGVPLESIARAFSRLANPWSANHDRGSLTTNEAVAVKWIVAAMTAYPEMVGGTSGRLDTDLMKATRGKLVSKIGAESVHAVAVLPDGRFPRGLGVAVKIEDGAKRALMPTVVEVLSQLQVIDQAEQAALVDYHRPSVSNHRQFAVGEIRPVFDLGLRP